MYWVANEDVLQMKAIEKIPLLDYFEILNTKCVRAKKAKDEHDRRERERRINQAKKK